MPSLREGAMQVSKHCSAVTDPQQSLSQLRADRPGVRSRPATPEPSLQTGTMHQLCRCAGTTHITRHSCNTTSNFHYQYLDTKVTLGDKPIHRATISLLMNTAKSCASELRRTAFPLAWKDKHCHSCSAQQVSLPNCLRPLLAQG